MRQLTAPYRRMKAGEQFIDNTASNGSSLNVLFSEGGKENKETLSDCPLQIYQFGIQLCGSRSWGDMYGNCVSDKCGSHSAEISKVRSRTVRSLPCRFTQPTPSSFPTTTTRIHFHIFFVTIIPASQLKTNVTKINLVYSEVQLYQTSIFI